MDEREKAAIRRKVHIAGIVVLLAVVAYMIYAGIVLKNLGSMYAFVIGVGIFLFWLLENVALPVLTKAFDEMSEQQKSTYKKCTLLSLAGYAGLVYFAVSFQGKSGIYGAVVYVVTLMMKRRIQEEQDAADEEEQDAADEDAQDVIGQDTAGQAVIGMDAEVQGEPDAEVQGEPDAEVQTEPVSDAGGEQIIK